MVPNPTKVLITGKLHQQAIERFSKSEKYTLEYKPDCSRETLLDMIAQFEVLITRSETKVDREVIERAQNLRVIGRAAVGVGNIDIDFATEKGVLVINCPGKNTNSAAELTVGLLNSMVRKIPQAHQKIKDHKWDRHEFQGYELRDKKIGIVGLGNVGHRVAKFCNGFDMKVFAFDPYISPEVFRRNRVEAVDSLENLAKKVDILSVHVPLNQETRGMVDSRILSLMPPSSYILNVARGGVVDEDDLLKSLETKHIAGAGIDTWENEPNIQEALSCHQNVWASPHIGATTVEAQLAIGTTIFEQVNKAIAGEVVDFPINMPQVGVIDNPDYKPFTVLSEKLGRLTQQLMNFSPEEIEIHYRGELSGIDKGLIRLGFMKGFVRDAVDGYVSFVNAKQHFEKLGIGLLDAEDPKFDSYRSALKIYIRGEGAKELVVGGTVFDQKFLRLSLIDDFYFEIAPEGEFLLIENDDKPGVVGSVGTYLANQKVNIDCFDLSRNQPGGRAMAVIRLDDELSNSQISDISKLEHVLRVESFSL